MPEKGIDLTDFLRQQENALIVEALRLTNGVVARAVDLLHVKRSTLIDRIRRFGIDRSAWDASSDPS